MSILEDFLHGIDNESNYRLLLYLALEETRGSTHSVLELGPSAGSTPYLHAYCETEGRPLVSMDEDIFMTAKWSHLRSVRHEVQCCAWSAAPIEKQAWSVGLINHAPGDRRWADAMRLHPRSEILVLHNTEPAADHGYRFSQIWGEFKYRADVKTGGAWATAVSNTRDLHKWRGMKFGEYVGTAGFDDVRADATRDLIERLTTTLPEA